METMIANNTREPIVQDVAQRHARYTSKMQEANALAVSDGYPNLPACIKDRVNMSNESLTSVATYFGVSKSTFAYWTTKLGLTFRYVAIAPGEFIRIESPRGVI